MLIPNDFVDKSIRLDAVDRREKIPKEFSYLRQFLPDANLAGNVR
jgi:hypothetical protein